MPDFKVALLYDQKTLQRHRPFVSDAVQAAGGVLLQDDSNSGGSDIPREFERRVRDADVIVVDITTESTDIGYELGYYLRPDDQRLIFVTFAQGSDLPGKVHFYLRQRYVFDLSGVLAGGIHAALQHQRLVAAISATGRRQSQNPIPKVSLHPHGDSDAASILSGHDVILRAPGAAFIFGEFAVTAGHTALHLPIPRYVYVGLRYLAANQRSRIVYMSVNSSGRTQKQELMTRYRDGVVNALEMAIPGGRPMEITICSQAPTMCGLGTSSALAACLGLYAARRRGILASDEYVVPHERGSGNLLQPGGVLNQVFRLTWLIDLAFHSTRGSGAGSFASLIGTRGPNPVIFLSAARRLWAGDRGNYPWDLAEGNLDTQINEIPCFGFRPELNFGEVASKPWHFALVYTGATKSTGWAMSSLESMSRYFVDRSGTLLQIVKSLRSARDSGAVLQESLRMRLSDEYLALLGRALSGDPSLREKTLSDHVRVSLMTLLEAYGNITLAGINSYWSTGDEKFLVLMEACQSVLDAMNVAQIERDSQVGFEPARLAHALNGARDDDGRRIFGAKIIGGGTGGDLIVMSNTTDGDTFERHLRAVLADAKYDCHSEFSDYGKVHFSTTWLDAFPAGYVAEPAQLLQGD